MTASLREQVMIVEKENRRMRHKLKHAHDAYKKLEAEKQQIEEDSFKEKALPAHYKDIEEKLVYYKNRVHSLTLENNYLEKKVADHSVESSSITLEDSAVVSEFQQKIALQNNQIEVLIAEKNQLNQQLKISKAEIAEVLIDAKIQARKIVKTADDEVIYQKSQAKKDIALFAQELQEKQQTILQSKLDITHLFEEIDNKMSLLTITEMN
ncbi:hypothetical protein ACWOFR_08170 [Carnobacterium gallinarum]|uniref:hypothetical protein n=1 Tax=Carnobacterium gallinarum TaxID=2749 RepID=UPI000552F247|nr:hypothetical protein [Carnobacterium gallinarum]